MSLKKGILSRILSYLKVEGISGKNKVCTLQPFEVLQIIEDDKPKPSVTPSVTPSNTPIPSRTPAVTPSSSPQKDPEPPKPPSSISPITIIDWLISILKWFKGLLNKNK